MPRVKSHRVDPKTINGSWGDLSITRLKNVSRIASANGSKALVQAILRRTRIAGTVPGCGRLVR